MQTLNWLFTKLKMLNNVSLVLGMRYVSKYICEGITCFPKEPFCVSWKFVNCNLFEFWYLEFSVFCVTQNTKHNIIMRLKGVLFNSTIYPENRWSTLISNSVETTPGVHLNILRIYADPIILISLSVSPVTLVILSSSI